MEKQHGNTRPPIVAVLGHVDHGKTSLLDKIRNTNLAAREAGGITQSIGAWQVKTPRGDKITFIDTPGHEAFAKMRARGAKVADIVILVVAADDGVMPQTAESLQYIKEAKVPFLVAITKVDLPGVSLEKVKTQLVNNGVMLEGLGGDVVAVEVSSVTGQGVEELLEMISLVAQMNDIKGDSGNFLEAPVVETLLDRRRGPVVRAIVRDGTLRTGDIIGADGISGRVRGLFDENRKPRDEATPGMPVEILGFEKLPPTGAVLKSVVKGVEENIVPQEKTIHGTKGFPVILKADTAGSLEAIENKLPGTVGVKLSGTGDISESDVLLASITGSVIVGFNVRASKNLLKLTESEKVKIYTYKIIYELLSDIDKWLKEKEDQGQEKILGRAQVVAKFPHDKKNIAGCKILEGRILKSDKLVLIRDNKPVGNVYVKSLKKGKLDVDKAVVGEECGILFDPQLDFTMGDVLESWK